MHVVEHQRRTKTQKERRAKPARRSLAFNSPRPQLLGGFTKESLASKPKPSDGDFVAAIRGSIADAFFGASPVVASALGIRLGATPRGPFQCKPSSSALPRKEDISTLLGIGHFYFALTPGVCMSGWRQARCTLRRSRLSGCAATPCRHPVIRIAGRVFGDAPGSGRGLHQHGEIQSAGHGAGTCGTA